MALALAVALGAAGCGGGTEAGAGAGPDPTALAPDGTGLTSAPPGSATVAATRSPGCDAEAGDAAAGGAVPATSERVDIASGGADRWYDRVVPTAYDGTPVPLVVDLHGYLSGAAGQAAMSDLASTAEEAGFVLATPQGSSELPYWNAVPHAELPDDVTFVADVIDDVGTDLCIDPSRVYVDGFSNGAFLTSLIACELSDRVAAVAAVAGLLLPEGCDPVRPVPVLAIHGTEDRHVSFDGPPNPALADLTWNDQSRAAFDGLPFAAVTTTAGGWAALDGCDADPTRTVVADGVELVAYTGCAGGSTVELYVVEGGGHAWPGSAFSAASASILGPTTDAIDANELIWSFFDDHPMP